MTDNEIIKALECCVEGTSEVCRECVLALTPYPVCKTMVASRSLDLINRQKAEIERLKEDNEIKSQKRANIFEITNAYERGRAEAAKEFAERLKIRLERKYTTYGREYVLRHLRELVKEFTEGE